MSLCEEVGVADMVPCSPSLQTSRSSRAQAFWITGLCEGLCSLNGVVSTSSHAQLCSCPDSGSEYRFPISSDLKVNIIWQTLPASSELGIIDLTLSR